MAGKVNFELDLAKLLSAAQSLPSVLSALPGGGPAWLKDAAPAIGQIATMAGQFVSFGEEDPVSAGMTHLGPRGEGRDAYLRNSSQWSDEEVALAADAMLYDDRAPSSVRQMRGAVEFALQLMGEPIDGRITPSYAKMRTAVDTVLKGTALPTAQRDLFGDALCYTLKARSKR